MCHTSLQTENVSGERKWDDVKKRVRVHWEGGGRSDCSKAALHPRATPHNPPPPIISYFALEQLLVGADHVIFLCGFGDIPDVPQQFVLSEELNQHKRK